MKTKSLFKIVLVFGLIMPWIVTPALGATTKPNIIVIMGDDIGWFNIGAYHQGIMIGKTPNIDKLAREGMRFTDYYAEASCTAGRAAFITGELPIRTGLTTVGQAGAKVGIPKPAVTLAQVLKPLGYATGQFGKNHLGDLNEYLPCVHGFDEFYGYLYHLDAMEDPFYPGYPKNVLDKVGPRNVVHCWESNTDDRTVEPRWGIIGKQRLEDGGALSPERMKTFDDEIVDRTLKFIDGAQRDGKPFFIWMNPTRMHVYTHLAQKYVDLQKTEGYGMEEAGMAQLDDMVGSVMKKLRKSRIDDNTIVVFTTDNGAEVFTWPDGGMTPFRGAKGTLYEGGFRAPAIVRWPGKIKPGKVSNGIFSGQDWFPTLATAAGAPKITEELLLGKTLRDEKFKVHLDGYDQTDLLTGAGPSKRHEVFYFVEANLGAVRVDDYKYVFLSQPTGWFGPKLVLDWPELYNLRWDPFERAWFDQAPPSMYHFFGHEFWRFVFVQNVVASLGQTIIDYPPMQKSASFNIEQIKEKIVQAIHGPSSWGPSIRPRYRIPD